MLPAAAAWNPSSPELAKPAVDPAADVEVIRAEYRIVDGVVAQGFDRLIDFSQVLMVYTERGAASEALATIPYPDLTTIENLSIRVTLPDGTRRMVQPGHMADQEVLSVGRVRLRERRYAIPGLRPGCLLEVNCRIRALNYKYVEHFFAPMQGSQPVRSLVVRLRPWPDEPFTLSTSGPTPPSAEPRVDSEGYRRIEFRNLPAWRDEPAAPMEIRTRTFLWGRYGTDHLPARMARFRAAQAARNTLAAALPLGDSAAVIVARIGEQGPGRLSRLYEWCQDSLANFSSREADPRRVPSLDYLIDRPDVTFARRESDGAGINIAFAALALAAGFDVRLAALVHPVADAFGLGTQLQFSDKLVVAIADRGHWRFYDPGDEEQPPGFLSPEYEGTPAILLGGPGTTVEVPRAPGRLSVHECVGELTLDAEGDATGWILGRGSGHIAVAMREAWRPLDDEARQRDALAGLLEKFPTARADSFVVLVEPAEDAPIVWRCRLRIPGLATFAGNSALALLDPFASPTDAMFADTIRTLPYDWAFRRQQRLHLFLRAPAGMRWIAPRLPADLESSLGVQVRVRAEVIAHGGVLEYTRERVLGEGRLWVPPAEWPALRAAMRAAERVERAQAELVPAGSTPESH